MNVPEVTVHASIIIPTCNRPERLCRTLRGLDCQTTSLDFEVLVVDDSLKGDAAAIARCSGTAANSEPIWLLSRNGRQRGVGPSCARNVGINAARGEVLIFLDDDMVVAEGFIDAHVRFHRSRRVAAIGLRRRVPSEVWVITPPDNPAALSAASRSDPRLAAFLGGAWSEAPWAYFTTCNASALREDVLAAGMFDEGFVGWGFEDSEFAYRLLCQGVEIDFELGAVGYHLECPRYDMTKARGPHYLPPHKLRGYLRNSRRFADKCSDPAVRELLALDRQAKLDANAGNAALPLDHLFLLAPYASR